MEGLLYLLSGGVLVLFGTLLGASIMRVATSKEKTTDE